jgi:hypothetical protein
MSGDSLLWDFFGHGIRNDHEVELKAAYIRQIPVVKQLCIHPSDRPWVLESIDQLPG